jgi:hypothetical protein
MMQGANSYRYVPGNPRKPRDPLFDPFRLNTLKDLDNRIWADFKSACVRNGHTPVQALEILMTLYVEDKSFTPTPPEPVSPDSQ